MIICLEDELQHTNVGVPGGVAPINPQELAVQEEEEFALMGMLVALGVYNHAMGILHPLSIRKLPRLDVTIASLDDQELLIRTGFNREQVIQLKNVWGVPEQFPINDGSHRLLVHGEPKNFSLFFVSFLFCYLEADRFVMLF